MKVCINSLNKNYGMTCALSEVDLDINTGITAILGPNGSGKSTLMNILSGNIKSSSGSIKYSTDNNIKNAFDDEYRSLLGFMPQYPGLYPNFSVFQFMRYMAALKNVGACYRGREKKEFISNNILEILNEVGLSDRINCHIDSLSGGMKQRLALAQAVLGDSSIILLDEPTAGLDPKQRISIRNYISRIAFDKIVMIATHVVSDIEFIASKIIILKKGKVIDFESPQVLCNRIRNIVWNVPCIESEIKEIQNRVKIINISKDAIGNRISLRVLSETSPTDSSTLVTPTLEDYYMYIFDELIT